jgi:glutathione synthase/RimK-type ligase-like ATP-grasp enzyme
MKSLIVVENPRRWPFEVDGAEVVAARAYLVEPRFAAMRRAAVYNVCRRIGYQTVGYYVSLLAAARGHRALPSVATVQALSQSPLVRIAGEHEDLEREMQRALGRLRADEFRLSIYFGRNVARRYDRLCRAIFNQFPAPFLVVKFLRTDGRWRLLSVRLGAASEVPEKHREFVLDRAQEFFSRPAGPPRPSRSFQYDLAILWSADDQSAPSNERAIKRFIRAAARQGIDCSIIEPDDYGRLAEFDALFLRETTKVDHHTYRFATRAVAEGLVVLDHPDAIVRATNKVYQAELFDRNGIPSPRTFVVHEGNRDEVPGRVGLPCVLKKPDGAFSIGVVKASTAEEVATRLEELLEESELVVAQEFTPSDFDWRIGVLDRRPLYACRYHMAKGHWQIVQQLERDRKYGRVEAVAFGEVPQLVLDTALRAASLFGDGLYGVDLKEVDGRVVVMEVNDNPNLDAGYEDAVLKDVIYDEIARWFRARLDRRGSERGGR